MQKPETNNPGMFDLMFLASVPLSITYVQTPAVVYACGVFCLGPCSNPERDTCFVGFGRSRSWNPRGNVTSRKQIWRGIAGLPSDAAGKSSGLLARMGEQLDHHLSRCGPDCRRERTLLLGHYSESGVGPGLPISHNRPLLWDLLFLLNHELPSSLCANLIINHRSIPRYRLTGNNDLGAQV